MSVKNGDSFSRAGDVVKALFDRISPSQLQHYCDFNKGWERLVGEEMAFHVVPRDIVAGALILEADHPGWSQKIRMAQEGIVREIRTRYPELDVRKIRVKVGGKSPQFWRTVSPPQASTQEVSSHSQPKDEAEDRSFFDLLEKMKRRANP